LDKDNKIGDRCIELMGKADFRTFAEYYDRLYSRRKDYENEAEIIRKIIKEYGMRKPTTLLDVGCGTGEHLKHLSRHFQCTGLDIDRRMIEEARGKVPRARFIVANMVNFRRNCKFNVIISMFSSIGYVQTYENLVKTLENLHRYLKDDGLVLMEPWVFKKDFKKGHISLDTYEDEKVKFTRMVRSQIVGSKWLIFMHYLVGKNGKINYFTEVHEMLALDYSDYKSAFEKTGFEDVEYKTENLWDGCRGLFIAIK